MVLVERSGLYDDVGLCAATDSGKWICRGQAPEDSSRWAWYMIRPVAGRFKLQLDLTSARSAEAIVGGKRINYLVDEDAHKVEIGLDIMGVRAAEIQGIAMVAYGEEYVCFVAGGKANKLPEMAPIAKSARGKGPARGRGQGVSSSQES